MLLRWTNKALSPAVNYFAPTVLGKTPSGQRDNNLACGIMVYLRAADTRDRAGGLGAAPPAGVDVYIYTNWYYYIIKTKNHKSSRISPLSMEITYLDREFHGASF